MAMSVGGDEGGTNAEINITPLADVMLVLLIIFMITAPLAQHKIKVTLPQANPESENPKKLAPPIDVAVEKDGTMFWEGSSISQAELRARLLVQAQKSPQPPLQIRADKTTRYKVIRKVLETAKASGMVHIEFVTSAPPKH
jgi:biopolymer transport protein ExbD